MTRTSTVESYRERVARVLGHIEARLDEPLPLEELAGVACFSPYHFHRIFHGMVGESVKEHVRRLRLERAARRLAQSAQPVTDIAFEAGYETHESFTRAFHAMFGAPPSGFRESRRQLASAPFRFEGPPRGGTLIGVEIEPIEEMRLAYIRHVGPYEAVSAAWGRLMSWAWPKGLLGPATRLWGVVHDDPEAGAPERLRYDAAITAPPGIAVEGEVRVQTIEPGEYAAAIHRGPYATIGGAYARVCGEWLPFSGRELRGAPALELYLNSPQTAAPADLLTRIYLPLE